MSNQLSDMATHLTQLPTDKISNQYEGIKALGLLSDTAACGHYRLINIFSTLKRHGANVEWTPSQDFHKLLQYDLIIAPRQHDVDTYEMLRALQWEGKTVIYEIDDDLFTVRPTNPAYNVYHPGAESLVYVEKFLRNSNGVTVTTPELAHTYSKFNSNISVLPNYIDFSIRNWACDVEWVDGQPIFNVKRIKKAPEFEDKIVIGWAGGVSHLEDLKQIIKPLQTVLNKYDNVVFAFYGDINLFNATDPSGMIDRSKVIHVKPRHFLDFPEGLFGVDIGLCPILGCEFNLSKSCLKPLEMMAAGQAVIASNVGPYSRLAKTHPGLIQLVGNSEGTTTWENAMSYLIENTELRQDLQLEGRRVAVSHYSLETNFHHWPNHWNQLAMNSQKGLTAPAQNIKPLWGNVERNSPCPCGSQKKYKRCCVTSHG